MACCEGSIASEELCNEAWCSGIADSSLLDLQVSTLTRAAAQAGEWLPGSKAPAHLEKSE